MAELSPIIESLDESRRACAAILCDVWGVIHNGVRAFQPATAALTRVREKGLAVVLVTSSAAPEPRRDRATAGAWGSRHRLGRGGHLRRRDA